MHLKFTAATLMLAISNPKTDALICFINGATSGRKNHRSYSSRSVSRVFGSDISLSGTLSPDESIGRKLYGDFIAEDDKHIVTPFRVKKHENRKPFKTRLNKKKRKRLSQNKKKNCEENDDINILSTEVEIAQHAARNIGGRKAPLNDASTTSRNENSSSINRLEKLPTLVLNADYQPMSYLPLSLWRWQETVKAVWCGKATVVDVYPAVYVKAVNFDMLLPSVIALNEYVPGNYKSLDAPFTRRNVFLRDGYRCQYCGGLFPSYQLTFDHVKPRCNGGGHNWENVVTCCRTCNGRKGCLEVNQLKSVGMKLLKEPRAPSTYELSALAGKLLPRRIHSTWIPYMPAFQIDNERGSQSKKSIRI